MRILFLCHSFNSLSQRLYVELAARGHELSIEFDINDRVSIEACALFEPQIVIAPFLKRAIPEQIWRRYLCLVVHPGIVGDRGPSALDWAIARGESRWGVTVLQANGVMDGGDVWAWREFPMRSASKSSLYRHEVSQAAVQAVLESLEKHAAGGFVPTPPAQCFGALRGAVQPPMRQADRRIDWTQETTAGVLTKLRAADSQPGVLDEIAGLEVFLHQGVAQHGISAMPGQLIGQRQGAILRATVDGAVWIGQLKARSGEHAGYKLPAAQALGERIAGLAVLPLPALPPIDAGGFLDIGYEQVDGVGYLHFPFCNGAMSTEDCRRLRAAFLAASGRDTEVIVLMGGDDFWSNGINLNTIEAADSPADESWANIEAMDELCLAILDCQRLTIAAMRGNAGAGGVFLALAADEIWAHSGVVLNPHYKGMGNLYGSEYWTYLLPRRVGTEAARAITASRLPVGAPQACASGLIDACFGDTRLAFEAELRRRAQALATDPQRAARVAAKREARARDEALKPLAAYREEELACMKLNFYGFDPSYHVARYHFVHRLPHAWTPLTLAQHRRRQWQRQQLLSGRGIA